MAAWTLPGLGVKFGPSSFFSFFLFLKPAFFFFWVIDRICFVFCVFFFFWVGLINKFCVSVMAVLKFLLCLYLIFFNLCRLRLLKTCYCSVKLQQYFLYKSGSISYLLYT